MKIKLALFTSILAFAAAIGLAAIYTVPQTSAEEFAENFAARGLTAGAEEMSGIYEFDKNHSTIGFRVKHLGLVEIPGYFGDFKGTINYDAKDISKSTVEFTAKTTSIDTAVAARDDHLRSKDFFEVAVYPEMKFKSTKLVKSGNTWMVTGDLTIKDVTKQISFPINIAGFAEQRGTVKMGATAQTTVNRREYNVNWGTNMANGVAAVSDEVKVDLQIEAALQKKEDAAAPKKPAE